MNNDKKFEKYSSVGKIDLLSISFWKYVSSADAWKCISYGVRKFSDIKKGSIRIYLKKRNKKKKASKPKDILTIILKHECNFI